MRHLVVYLALASAVAVSGCGDSATPSSIASPQVTWPATSSSPPIAQATEALYRQLGLAPASGIVLTADPTQIPVPKAGQYLSGLSDFQLANQSSRSAWILPNETVFRWTGSSWERIGCANEPLDEDDRFGFCAGGVTVKIEIVPGAVANESTDPIGYYISWPLDGSPSAPVTPGLYAFVLPVWDSELAAERQPPRTAAVLVVELVERP